MITLALETFEQSREGCSVTGVVSLKSEGGEFPSRGWSDFPVIILGWWMDAWFQLEVPMRREVQWRFMDGPYSATLTKTPSGGLRSTQVRTYLLEAGERVVAHCDRNGMASRDLELLRGNVGRLKANQRTAEDAGFALQFSFERQRPGASDSGRYSS